MTGDEPEEVNRLLAENHWLSELLAELGNAWQRRDITPITDRSPRHGIDERVRRFGNLVALPLQSAPCESGGSVSVDRDLQTHDDQWAFFAGPPKMPPADIEPTSLRATGGSHPLSPFISHVWDGPKDSVAALMHDHKLDAKKLQHLIHLYLGRWISGQEDGVRNGVDATPTRLAAALILKRRLELILEGEKPCDIFVRWKPLAKQPISWSPDLNDGVRLNIRPFMTVEVLRHHKKPKLNITWDKDRGKDVESALWFKVFKGDRINDHHLTLAEKRAASAAKGEK
jgi:hypothetical protein